MGQLYTPVGRLDTGSPLDYKRPLGPRLVMTRMTGELRRGSLGTGLGLGAFYQALCFEQGRLAIGFGNGSWPLIVIVNTFGNCL